MSTWTNNDGLYIRYGQGEVTAQTAGQYGTPVDGGSHVIEVRVPDLTVLALATDTIVGDGLFIPKNFTLERVELVTDTAVTSGGSATLDVGFIQASDRTTAIDADGAVAALAIASFNAAGETVTLTPGVTSAGALVGAVVSTTQPAHVTVGVNAAVFTAGAITIRLILRRK